MMQMNDKNIIKAWCSYDIANSVYKLIITSAIFPIYYMGVTKGVDLPLKSSVLYTFAFSFAYLLVAFMSPLISGIADAGNNKKLFMRIFTYLGSFSCLMMYWFHGENIFFGLATIIFAAIGYEGSLLFYNSFLPIIATKDMHDTVSAKGFSWGYGGSMFLLILTLIFIIFHDTFGIEKAAATRYSFIMVAMWWFSIAHIALSKLKEDKVKTKFSRSLLTRGLKELKSVQKYIANNLVMRRFLIAFFFYAMALETVMLIATQFGIEELGLPQQNMIATIIILQVLAIVGATIFAYTSRKKGNKFSISIMLLIWMIVCIAGYFIQTAFQFYILAGAVGLVMGGIQSQSRSTFSKLIPSEAKDIASFFSFYSMAEKLAIVIGMFSFGLIEQISGSKRNSILALIVYFIIAFIIFRATPLNLKKYTVKDSDGIPV